ncbi:hypothetical protein, partial [Mycobacterium intracellulare]|uniref:hypothetical protein n=1 Tax=Mycobacterium intracellulare TaxID=1767 RepID=UPI001E589F5E
AQRPMNLGQSERSPNEHATQRAIRRRSQIPTALQRHPTDHRNAILATIAAALAVPFMIIECR